MKKRKFYIRGESDFIEVKGEPVVIDGFPKYDFFIYRQGMNPDFYQITEGTTGHSIAGNSHKLTAIETAKERLIQHKKQLARVIRKTIKKYGLSPAYKKEIPK